MNWLILILYTVFPIGALILSKLGKRITPDYLLPSLFATFFQKEMFSNVQLNLMVPIGFLNIFVLIVMLKGYGKEYTHKI